VVPSKGPRSPASAVRVPAGRSARLRGTPCFFFPTTISKCGFLRKTVFSHRGAPTARGSKGPPRRKRPGGRSARPRGTPCFFFFFHFLRKRNGYSWGLNENVPAGRSARRRGTPCFFYSFYLPGLCGRGRLRRAWWHPRRAHVPPLVPYASRQGDQPASGEPPASFILFIYQGCAGGGDPVGRGGTLEGPTFPR